MIRAMVVTRGRGRCPHATVVVTAISEASSRALRTVRCCKRPPGRTRVPLSARSKSMNPTDRTRRDAAMQQDSGQVSAVCRASWLVDQGGHYTADDSQNRRQTKVLSAVLQCQHPTNKSPSTMTQRRWLTQPAIIIPAKLPTSCNNRAEAVEAGRLRKARLSDGAISG